MRGEFTEVDLRAISAAERNCSENFFGDLAVFLWPDKAAHHLAAHTGASERMCRYWLSGSHKPTGRAVQAIFAEVARRLK
jgi:hypothetical protein